MQKLIAEAGLAHMGDIGIARRMIDFCADAGADYVKFQVYKTEELIDWSRDSYRYKRFKDRELTYTQFAQLKEYCEDCNIKFLATPHTTGAFHFLEDLGVEEYKIGSGDRGEVLNLAIKTGKHIYLSLGLRDSLDIREVIYNTQCADITYLHCITQYPVLEETCNLGFLKTLEAFVRKWGYSDHFPETYACELAAAMGAQVIEKHIKVPESEGQDCECAIFEYELKALIKKLKKIERMMGPRERLYSNSEKENESWALKGANGLRPYLY